MRQAATDVGQLIIGCVTAHGKAREPKFVKTANNGAMATVLMRAARTEAEIGPTGEADAAIGTGSIRTTVDTTRRERANSPGADAVGRMTTASTTVVAATRKGMPIRMKIENALLFGMVAHPRALLLRLLRSLSIAPAAIRAV